MVICRFIVCYVYLIGIMFGYNNGINQLKPAMGWNTWCTTSFCGSDICSESEVKMVANAMKSNGMYNLGYNRINLDDCWEHCGGRSKNGTLRWDEERFPNGIKSLADYLHNEGFLMGIYTSSGTEVCSRALHCADKPTGSYGYYEIDANTFAEWGIDYVKIDHCGKNPNSTQQELTQFSNYLNKTGRSMWVELCRGYGNPAPEWVPAIANSWRVTGDHKDHWINTRNAIMEYAKGSAMVSGPYNWAYNDFLMTGGEGCYQDLNPDTDLRHCPGMTKNEYKTEFSIWAITASPLIVATDVRNMTQIMKEALLNEEIINVNQNYLQPPGNIVSSLTVNCSDIIQDACQVWARAMNDTSIAVVLLNLSDEHQNITVIFDQLPMNWNENSNINIRDLWNHKNIGIFTQNYTELIDIHSVSFIELTLISPQLHTLLFI